MATKKISGAVFLMSMEEFWGDLRREKSRKYWTITRILCTVCHTSHPPGAIFQGRLLDNQEDANTERQVFGKLSARRFQRRSFRPRHYSNCCGDIIYQVYILCIYIIYIYRAWNKGPGGCDMHRRMRYAAHTMVLRYHDTMIVC